MAADRTPNVPDAEQRRQYVGFLKLWQRRLNLCDWRIALSGKKATGGAMADIAPKVPDRVATARLGDFGGHKITPNSLESTAVHELLHVALAPLIHACLQPDTTQEIVAGLEHSLITTLESLLVPNTEDDNADTKAE